MIVFSLHPGSQFFLFHSLRKFMFVWVSVNSCLSCTTEQCSTHSTMLCQQACVSHLEVLSMWVWYNTSVYSLYWSTLEHVLKILLYMCTWLRFHPSVLVFCMTCLPLSFTATFSFSVWFMQILLVLSFRQFIRKTASGIFKFASNAWRNPVLAQSTPYPTTGSYCTICYMYWISIYHATCNF